MSFGNIDPPSIRVTPQNSDDDIADRLHHRWTVMLLALLALLVTYQEYVGDPIHCWCPAQFTDSHCNYTESLCWIQENYFVPIDESLPTDEGNKNAKVKYYPWVPTILLFLALCYKGPNIIWTMMKTASGANLYKMICRCNDCQIGDQREVAIEEVGDFLHRWLTTSKRATYGTVHTIIEKISACFCFCLGKRTGTYLAGLYLGVKICYLAVSVSMILLLNKFLAIKYTFYGYEVLESLVANRELPESPRFPTVILCEFDIRQLQNIQRFTVQCVLSVNLYNDKIFAFLWFWFVIMMMSGLYSYIMWMKKILIPSIRRDFVNKYLGYIDKELLKKKNSKVVAKFTRDYLSTDGVFALRMIEYNTSEMVVMELMRLLWDKSQISLKA
ncbi:innexin unc-9-like isoform X2 [Haliotis rubra]|uniref:innexin unc-9-like isoform X2 n=1 Tax=Haliotis rubra TaxID=36100 RepID=UPI001EE5B392|nr:innexin unc-9-like isoform X2 [Haliotis rubra]